MFNFWSMVEKLDYCWLWNGSRNKNGYGRFGASGRVYIAARISYWMHFKIDPKELEVCHECSNPPCVNPAHLWRGTHSENLHHSVLEGRFTTKVKTVVETS